MDEDRNTKLHVRTLTAAHSDSGAHDMLPSYWSKFPESCPLRFSILGVQFLKLCDIETTLDNWNILEEIAVYDQRGLRQYSHSIKQCFSISEWQS